MDRDHILVNDLLLDDLLLRPSPWSDHRHQPAYLTLVLSTDTSLAGSTDDLQHSTNYSAIAKGLRNHLGRTNFPEPLSASELAERAARYILFDLLKPRSRSNSSSSSDNSNLNVKSDSVRIRVVLPDALLRGGTLSVEITRDRQDYHHHRSKDEESPEDLTQDSASSKKKKSLSSSSPDPRQDSSTSKDKDFDLLSSSRNARQDSLSIDDFTISTIIGLNDCERIQEQPLILHVTTWPNFDGLKRRERASDMAWCARTLQEAVWSVSVFPSFTPHIPTTRTDTCTGTVVLCLLSTPGPPTPSSSSRSVPPSPRTSSPPATCPRSTSGQTSPRR